MAHHRYRKVENTLCHAAGIHQIAHQQEHRHSNQGEVVQAEGHALAENRQGDAGQPHARHPHKDERHGHRHAGKKQH